MKRILTIAVLLVAPTLPSAALAKPDDAHRQAAHAQCKAERGKSSATREAFRSRYASLRSCVRARAAEEEAEDEGARKNAAKECKAEREADPAGFTERYGTNANGKNAYGKCVSSKAKEKKAEMDEEDAEAVRERKNAARECAAEREDIGREAFEAKHGTNPNGANAFGKCVSKRSRESKG
jgi:hypothetical protein